MQNRGAIRFFAIAFAAVCLFQLLFTFFASRIEKKAKEYAFSEKTEQLAKELAKGNADLEGYFIDSIAKARETYYLDSVSDKVAMNILIRKYTYKEVKEKEINLGLDLKGGMNVTLEVNAADIIKALSGNSQDPTFNAALAKAKEYQKESQEDYVTLFGEAFKEVDPNAKLASIFLYEFKDKGITPNSTNAEVLKVIRKEANGAFDRTFNILRTRIDRFGVAQPNIQKLSQSGRILVELPGIKEPERVRKLLQGTAQLEFWETYKFNDVFQYFQEANQKLAETEKGNEEVKEIPEEKIDTEIKQDNPENPVDPSGETVEETGKKDSLNKKDEDELISELTGDSTASESKEELLNKQKADNPLWSYLYPSVNPQTGQPFESARIGSAAVKDTARINMMLKKVKSIFPRNLVLAWTVKPDNNRPGILDLVALKAGRDGMPAMGGESITDARQDYDQNGRVEVSLAMNGEGARTWKRLTGENIGNQIAIVLDGYVYSYPNVNSEISGGRSSISGGSMSVEEAKDLANILKAGKLPAPAHIVEESVVGPSLGKEAVSSGLYSFIFAFVLVLIYMIFFYNKAGWVANLALIINVFFIFGVLASLGAVLTLPGIAGIVLTLGMAVDANVIIYERIKEEVRLGKAIGQAIKDGYANAYSAIIDGNITTLITGIVLFTFGSGPVQGFATTLIIGILSSLFSSIFITRLVFSGILKRNKKITLDNVITKDFLNKANFDFIGARKKAYVFSIFLIVVGIASLFIRGLNYGVDFKGGRNYVVRFDQNVNVAEIREALTPVFEGDAPEVKTFGSKSQVKVTTDFLIDDETPAADSIVNTLIFDGLNPFMKNPIGANDFLSQGDQGKKLYGVLSSQKVGPTIADDIKKDAILAIFFSLLLIFIYIALRFKKAQYGAAGVIALFHDSLITIGAFSLLYGVLPFSLEIDQAFIAAILTIIGYSINDTVIIFDRIREYTKLYPKKSIRQNMNDGLNSTLARTINTSGTTILVLATIMIFGGEVLRGFIFALLLGIVVGTYSSLFTASPIAYDLMGGDKDHEEKTKKESKKFKKKK
ncbi:MAG: protein translocase subunit SecDF [Bacteroidales bacterium]